MTGLQQDLSHALRALRRAPAFTIVAVAALSLGIGANSAIFGVVQAVLLRPLPFHEPDRVVTLISTHSGRGLRDGGVSFADYYLDWKKQGDVFQSLALWSPRLVDLTGGEQPERVDAVAVTGEFFEAVGLRAQAGRTFDVSAEAEGDRPAVLSYGAWQRSFGERGDVIGQTIHLSGVPHTIVGVLQDRMVWPRGTEIYVPLRLRPDENLLRRDNFIFRSVARLKPGVPVEQARARVAALARAVEEAVPSSRAGWSYDAVALHDYVVGDELRGALLILMTAVGVVLLIACANVANLLLARGTARRRELAVRAALGASRGRLARTLLTESAVVALAGAAGGLAVGYWISRGLVAIAPADVAVAEPAMLDSQVVAFTAAAALAAVFIFGLLPAITTSVVTPNEALKEGPRAGGSARAGRLRDGLVVAEVALAVVLLVGAALLVRSLFALSRVDPGVDVNNVLVSRLIVPAARYPDQARRAQFYRSLIERVSALPGVSSAGVASRVPAGGPGSGLGRVFLREGQPEPPSSSDHPAQWTVVSPEYFTTLGVRFVKGRAFTSHDAADATPVIIISDRMAQQMFPGEDPLGRRIRSWRDENKLRTIVGVVADVRYFGLTDRPRSAVYVPHAQDSWGTMTLAVKTMGDPLSLVPAVRAQVTAIDPMLAIGSVGSLASFSASSVDENRFTARLLAAFAGLALLLAMLGVYGVMAYAVTRRSHEIGVRIAMGATRANIASLVIRRGLLLATVGLGLGLAAAAALARALRGMIAEVGPTDPVAFLAAPLMLMLVAVAACAIPAARASRLDPFGVLRQE